MGHLDAAPAAASSRAKAVFVHHFTSPRRLLLATAPTPANIE
jgi:hypothetical protein